MGKWLVNFRWLMVEQSRAEYDDLFKDLLLDLWEWDFFLGARVFNETLDEDRFLGDISGDFDNFTIVAKELHCFSHIRIFIFWKGSKKFVC